MSIEVAATHVREALTDASRGLVDREGLVELVALAAVAREHLLVIGPPGTAKSEAVRRVASALGGRFFEYLLGRFTEPGEIYGPVDLQRLREGVVEVRTEGMLPQAHVAFLDEVFQGSTAILNTLLGILNERVYRRGHTRLDCPLRVCVGASNAVPDDPTLAALADRFLVRVNVEPVQDPLLEDLLEQGWMARTQGRTATLDELDALAAAVPQADLSQVRPALAQAVRTLRSAGIHLTDRRVVALQRLVAAAGVLRGSLSPTRVDLWPLVYAVPGAESQLLARDALRELLSASESEALPAAAEAASAGPLVRARRLARAGSELLAERPPEGEEVGWRLRLEGVAREIDAGFASDDLPPGLAEVRQRIVAVLSP